jgi:hypothetical protein
MRFDPGVIWYFEPHGKLTPVSIFIHHILNPLIKNSTKLTRIKQTYTSKMFADVTEEHISHLLNEKDSKSTKRCIARSPSSYPIKLQLTYMKYNNRVCLISEKNNVPDEI